MSFAVWVIAGACVGVLSSFLGIGGGVVVVGMLVAFGRFEQHEAQATALAFMVPTAAIGAASARRRGLGDVRLSALVGISGALAAVAGAVLALGLPAGVLRRLFAAIIGAIGVTMLARRTRGGGEDPLRTGE